jgi:hypothetical protein
MNGFTKLTFIVIALIGIPGGLVAQKPISSERLTEALLYGREHGLDTNEAFFVDMSIHSGKYRLFLWNLQEDSLILQSLCTHGMCDGDNAPYNGHPSFSNIPESHCSSLGKYEVGRRSYSSWGINVHYKLHGKESSNDKAFQRVIVLHSWEAVKDEEIFPYKCVESWGCPSVSNEAMRKIDLRLKKKRRPTLLWIYR